MGRQSKIKKIAHKVSFEEAEDIDVNYWANLNIKSRMIKATEWIKEVWGLHKKLHGLQNTLPDGKQIKKQTDEDVF